MSIVNGQTGDATDFILASAGASDVGRVPKLNAVGKLDGSFFTAPIVRVYTANDTWTKPASLVAVLIEVIGAGGGTGGSNSGASPLGASGGGGAGGYSRKKVNVATLGATETVTVGAAGTAGLYNATTNPAGGTGGTSSFGAHASAVGGGGSNTTTTNSEVSGGGSGGTASSGDVNITGLNGVNALVFGATAGKKGDGGAANFGGASYGRGGAGVQGTDNGSAGLPGLVIVTEFYA